MDNDRGKVEHISQILHHHGVRLCTIEACCEVSERAQRRPTRSRAVFDGTIWYGRYGEFTTGRCHCDGEQALHPVIAAVYLKSDRLVQRERKAGPGLISSDAGI